MKYQIPVTLEHLEITRKLSESPHYSACRDCLLAMAIDEYFTVNSDYEFASMHASFCYVWKDGFTLQSEPSESVNKLTFLFDMGEFDQLKQMLPTTIELEFSE